MSDKPRQVDMLKNDEDLASCIQSKFNSQKEKINPYIIIEKYTLLFKFDVSESASMRDYA